MSEGKKYLHSHSGLERTLPKDDDLARKRFVLIDEEYASLFANEAIKMKPVFVHGVKYYKVPIMSFIRKGGVFKNLER